MTWVLPNYTSTLEYPVGSGIYPQSQWDEVDGFILQDGISGNGVSSGCAVTQRAAGANQSVDVASGSVSFGPVDVGVSSGNVAATAAHGSNPRFDLVVVSNAGVKSITAGTAAPTPVFPSIPANSVVLAALFRRPADNIIETAEIVDKRVPVEGIPISTASKSEWIPVLAGTTLGTTSNQILGRNFPASSDVSDPYTLMMPSNYAGGTIGITLCCASVTSAAANTVRWRINWAAIETGDSVIENGATIDVDHETGATLNIMEKVARQQFVPTGLAAGDLLRLNIERMGAHANDDYTGAMHLFGFYLEYDI